MEEVLAILKKFEHENKTFCEFAIHLQTNQSSTSLGCISITQPRPKEPLINLSDKFDGTRSKFQSFVNQMCLVIHFHLHRYPTGPVQIGLIDTLLLSTTLTWFTPLLKHQSPLFDNFEAFIKEFNATFGDSDKECTFNIKVQSFYK
jgi:hypothetical protein